MALYTDVIAISLKAVLIEFWLLEGRKTNCNHKTTYHTITVHMASVQANS